MQGPTIVLFVITAGVVSLDVWATIAVAGQVDLLQPLRRSQFVFIWLLPVVGAIVTLEAHRRRNLYNPCAGATTDEIYPPSIGLEDSSNTHSDGSH